MDLLDFTYFIFILVVIILILFPATYLSMNGQTLNLIQQRSVWKDLRILIPCILYAVILGFRYNYAFDWEQYRYTFEFLKNGHLYRETTEKGYLALNYLLIQLGFNYYSIFVFEGFLWIFSIAYIFSQNIVTLMSQLILMIGLMFSPIMYPASRLPDWLDQLYYLLPFVPSANLLRASFYRHGTVSLVDIGVLIFWIFLTQLLILGTLQKEL